MLAEKWIPKGKARHFNQALMELGAMICMPTSPSCLLCPINDHCQSFGSENVEQIPFKLPSKSPKKHFRACAVIRNDRSLFFNKRPEKALLEGLWEFPSMESDSMDHLKEKLEKYLMTNHGITVSLGEEFHHLDHRYTSYKTRVSFHEVKWQGPRVELNENSSWFEISKVKDLPLPSPYRKFINWYMNNIDQ